MHTPSAPMALCAARFVFLRGFLVAVATLLALVLGSWTASAQSTFPIPGMTGNSSTEAPAEDAPAEATTPADPTQALIELLQDEAARAALIAQLEQAAAGTAAAPEGSATAPAAAAPEATTTTTSTVGNFSTRLIQDLRTTMADNLRGFMARVERIPTTLGLAIRGLNSDLLLTIVRDLVEAVLVTYGALILLRLAMRPLLRMIGRKAVSTNWLYRFILRIIGTGLLALAIPIALVIGVAVVSVSVVAENGASLNTAQAAFFAAFALVEMLKLPSRFVLTPRTDQLRFIDVSDKAARQIQRLIAFAIGLAAYGQLVAVPVVTEQTSVFIGRAVATLLGAIVIVYLVGVVLAYRKKVGAWLTRYSKEDVTLDEVLSYFALRWHWPVLAYLVYVLVVVLTRPGNVLGPLAADTVRVVLILGIGGTVTMLARRATQRRVRLPEMVDSRLPLLASRLNRLLPAGLVVVRIAVVILVVLSILDVVELFDFSGYLGSDAGGAMVGAIFGVALGLVFVAVVYLAVSSWVDYQLNPFVGKPPTPRTVTLLTLLRNAVTIALVIFGGMFALSQLGLNIGPLLASAGVLGLAISFGAQKLVEDIITGIFIQFENAMNVGDVVDVGGVVGTVEKLTVRSVTLRDLQGVVHMIPFSSASMISNYMREFSYYVCDMGVAYREDIEMAKQAMFDAFEELRADPDQGGFLIDDLEWFGLNSFGDSAIVLRARIKTQPGKQWGVGRAYNLLLKKIFDDRGIEIPFPHQTIYFGEDRKGKAPPIHVMMQTGDAAASQAHPVTEAIPDARGPEQLEMDETRRRQVPPDRGDETIPGQEDDDGAGR
ncbi:putative mechanosensitive ion channel [Dinoroseobacter shibae DFL 12 = DSM 16493]|uniref:Putative mechanosensitive ion channel n=1 Tax=Dinoroseobacter shibae (strain DSM 16493 / NCIMB 14021 / DFL 12) TaxID=398580 RepID=A8LKE8_DINSH|nr:mechanosensitive ion channel domain-containing protein [Dinoroseobacter shibae]ABV94731.1 putative mechanosensitive ion channel [Dinoroseobacter shibae DFL 12 = DSM 16493]URF46152.1 mechanosensitive ion channel [Dinoroseobacter shibae]URF50459.1 mechanosensitive ion channel [Dinoroseobacter shibae]